MTTTTGITLDMYALRLVLPGIKELSPDALREVLGAATYEWIRRENVKAKARRRPV